ncbi:MAG: phosphoribosyltransferase family protein [Acidimicrobiales bacterium]|nr:hypoxanthine phosphoribosyltransferase [Actinomycetota bacterium]
MPPPQLDLLADPERLGHEVARVAAEISADHPDGVTLVGVLKGAVVFLADLARHVTVPTLVDFVAVTPFDGVSGRTRVVKDLDQSVTGRPVVLVTGIVDTGLTADFLHRHLQGARPSSVRVATLADRSARRLLPLQPDYRALEVPDRFLIGYGLDHRGRYRNVPGLWGVDAADLAEDPDRYVSLLYGADPSAGPGR